ncbi:MAG: hypothetical protein M3069_20925 [Chloroflexota bacterium]|nr:hypothetical protein [Chloroflexota bacterium]
MQLGYWLLTDARFALGRAMCASAVMLAAIVWPVAVRAQAAPYCAADEGPRFQFGFAALKQQLGTRMGDPIECEHVNPDNGDTLQLTTQGLAYYRKTLNTPIFTDGARHWGLTPDGIVAWADAVDISPEALAASTADVAPELDVLRGLPAVLVASSALRPFSSYPLTLVEPAASQSATYQVVYGNPDSDGAVIRGGLGQDLYAALDVSPEPLCALEDLYCQEGPLDADGQLTGERVRGLIVGGQPAVAIHATCCGVNHWTIAWYDEAADASYAIALGGAAAQPYGGEISPRDHDSARALSTLASSLVPLD